MPVVSFNQTSSSRVPILLCVSTVSFCTLLQQYSDSPLIQTDVGSSQKSPFGAQTQTLIRALSRHDRTGTICASVCIALSSLLTGRLDVTPL